MYLMSSKLWRTGVLLVVLALLVTPLAAFAEDQPPAAGRSLFFGVRPNGAAIPSTAPHTQAGAEGVVVIASGLDNPRGLTIVDNSKLYVAESGRGSETDCFDHPEFGVVCLGDTGAITLVDLRRGIQARVVTGLPSFASPGGAEAIGPSDVSIRGMNNAYATIGLLADPAIRATLGSLGEHLGYLIQLFPDGSADFVVDVAAYEAAANPAGGPVDSNPYSLVALPGGRNVVADAGGNALLYVDANTGAISTLAVFPSRIVPVDPLLQQMFGLPPAMPAEPVPNSVVLGPGNAFYVGELLGFPYTPGQSNVNRVVPGQAPAVYASGFTAITDLAFGPDGSLYVLEIAANGLLNAFMTGDWTGALIRVDPQGNRTEIAPGSLTAPGGITIGKDGVLYVTNKSIWPAEGEVLRIKP